MKKIILFIICWLFLFSCKRPGKLEAINETHLYYDDIKLKDSVIGYSYHTPTYARRNGQFKKYRVKGKIVWIGDSITDEIELNELFGRTDMVNRGIGSDIVQGVKERIKGYLIDSPKQIVLAIGVNNLRYFSFTNPTQLFLELENLVKEIHQYKIPVIIICPLKHSTLEKYEGFQPNLKIDTLNRLLLAAKNIGHFDYVNPNDSLAVNGFMRNDFTNDGIHLLAEGVTVIKKMVGPYLKK